MPFALFVWVNVVVYLVLPVFFRCNMERRRDVGGFGILIDLWECLLRTLVWRILCLVYLVQKTFSTFKELNPCSFCRYFRGPSKAADSLWAANQVVSNAKDPRSIPIWKEAGDLQLVSKEKDK